MARSIDDIQREIDRTRRQLAGTLDEIADRSNPSNLMDDAKVTAQNKLQDPQVQAVLGGIAAVIVLGATIAFARSRRRNKDLKELRELLAANL